MLSEMARNMGWLSMFVGIRQHSHRHASRGGLKCIVMSCTVTAAAVAAAAMQPVLLLFFVCTFCRQVQFDSNSKQTKQNKTKKGENQIRKVLHSWVIFPTFPLYYCQFRFYDNFYFFHLSFCLIHYFAPYSNKTATFHLF